jgi:hypothetical protein
VTAGESLLLFTENFLAGATWICYAPSHRVVDKLSVSRILAPTPSNPVGATGR